MNDYSEKTGRVRTLVLTRFESPKAVVKTYGCQQNEADSERMP